MSENAKLSKVKMKQREILPTDQLHKINTFLSMFTDQIFSGYNLILDYFTKK